MARPGIEPGTPRFSEDRENPWLRADCRGPTPPWLAAHGSDAPVDACARCPCARYAVSSGIRVSARADLGGCVAYSGLDDARPAVAERKTGTSSTTVLVSRRESFNAAHQLRDPGLTDAENQRLFGKCAHLHGHNYTLEVVVAGEIDPTTGYVIDLKLLSDVISRRIIEDVDHRNLNADVPWLEGLIPTAENLAAVFWERIRSELPAGSLRSVRLWETDKNWAEVGERF